MLKTLADTLADVNAKTVSDTLGDVEAQALADTTSDTLCTVRVRIIPTN